MNIIHYKEPFYHTIIENCFDYTTLFKIKKEILWLKNEIKEETINNYNTNSEHNIKLYKNHSIKSDFLDIIFLNKREKSIILNQNKKIYNVLYTPQNCTNNPYLNYIPITCADTTQIQIYSENTNYHKHHDAGILSFVYKFFIPNDGICYGDLIFEKENYTPKLNDNSCIIFPSYELHYTSKASDNRISILNILHNTHNFVQ